MRKKIEIKPYAFREYTTISEKVEERVMELQNKGHKVLSVSFSGFNSVATIVYRKTIWKAFKDWATKPTDGVFRG
jgi:hypothetical protein